MTRILKVGWGPDLCGGARPVEARLVEAEPFEAN